MFGNGKKITAYIITGAATTLVNYAVYFSLCELGGRSVLFSNIAAWVAAVIFAYFTNRKYVFASHDPKILHEFFTFGAGRVFSGVMETMFLWLVIDAAGFPNAPVKIAASFLSLVLNYGIANVFVFKKPANIPK